ncbi:hypothetical protein ABZ339_41880, partial [Streptomyces sp. NPDC005969]
MNSLVMPPGLLRWVTGIDVATAAGPAAVDVPDHATTLLLRIDKRELIVMGPRTRASYHVGAPVHSCVRVRMRPGRAQALLGRPLRDLADRALPLRELPGLDVDQLAADQHQPDACRRGRRDGVLPHIVRARLQQVRQ